MAISAMMEVIGIFLMSNWHITLGLSCCAVGAVGVVAGVVVAKK